MNVARLVTIGCLVPFLVAALVPAQEPVHWNVVDQMLDEAFNNSQVMENAGWLTDVFGPRNSKSSGYLAAAEWARQRLEDYGLSNARLEPFEFGRGWENQYTSFHMVAPRYMPIIGYPAPWSAGTNGKIRLQAVHVNLDEIESATDLDPYREEIPGKVVLIEPLRDLSDQYWPSTTPYTEAELDEMARIPIGPTAPRQRRRSRPGLTLEERIDLVFAAGATAVARTGSHAYGTVDGAVNGYGLVRRMWDVNAPPPITEWILASEHYNRMVRILEKGIPVEMEAEVRVDFPDDDTIDYNVVAEIPGTDLADELVLVGGHLQSEPIGTGATDNAAGVVISMEVVRIFQALGIRPRRDGSHRIMGRPRDGPFRQSQPRCPELRGSGKSRVQARLRQAVGILQRRQRRRPHCRAVRSGKRSDPGNLQRVDQALAQLGDAASLRHRVGARGLPRSRPAGLLLPPGPPR